MNSQPNKEETIKSNQDTTYTYSGDTLAFKLIGNHIISDVTIMDSLKVKAIFDTGAFQMNVDSTFAKEHNLIKGNLTKPGSRERIEYIKSLSKLGSRKSSIQLNGIFDSIPASIMNLHKIIGDKAQVLIGQEFMNKYAMEVNYKKGYIVFHKDKIIKSPRMISIPLQKGVGFYSMNADFNITKSYHIQVKCFFDLGFGPNGIGYGGGAVSKYKLLDSVNRISEPKSKIGFMGKKSIDYTGVIHSADINGVKINTPLVYLMTGESWGNNSTSGFIGNYFFSQFTSVIYDFPNKIIYITK